MYDAIQAETVRLAGASGDVIEAYRAMPLGPGPYGSVVVLHHAPGYDDSTKEITRWLATAGYLAICPNLFSREAPGLPVKEAAGVSRASGGVPDDRMVGDVAASAEYLRNQVSANGKVGVIGYCSGGRQAVLAACQLELDAAVDCYGAFVMRTAGIETGLPRQAFPELIARLSCPLLGLFGEEDHAPSTDEVAELEETLKEHDKSYEFHIYKNAGHAFMSVDSQKYRTTAALDGRLQIESWFDRYISREPVERNT